MMVLLLCGVTSWFSTIESLNKQPQTLNPKGLRRNRVHWRLFLKLVLHVLVSTPSGIFGEH